MVLWFANLVKEKLTAALQKMIDVLECVKGTFYFKYSEKLYILKSYLLIYLIKRSSDRFFSLFFCKKQFLKIKRKHHVGTIFDYIYKTLKPKLL